MTVQLFCGDCLDILPTLEAGSVDAVITDPPYPKKYLFLYWFVAEQSRQLLVQGGSYLAIVPHYAMENVLEKVGQHLKYRWIFSMWQAMGQHPRMAMGIEVMWKPIVWWINGSWPQGRGFVRDGFENSQPDKKHHKWEQSLDWAQYCLSVVPRGGTVVDPMMGGSIDWLVVLAASLPILSDSPIGTFRTFCKIWSNMLTEELLIWTLKTFFTASLNPSNSQI